MDIYIKELTVVGETRNQDVNGDYVAFELKGSHKREAILWKCYLLSLMEKSILNISNTNSSIGKKFTGLFVNGALYDLFNEELKDIHIVDAIVTQDQKEVRDDGGTNRHVQIEYMIPKTVGARINAELVYNSYNWYQYLRLIKVYNHNRVDTLRGQHVKLVLRKRKVYGIF